MLDLIELYNEEFGDVFPYQQLRGYSDEELIKIIEKALDDGKPIEIEMKPGQQS